MKKLLTIALLFIVSLPVLAMNETDSLFQQVLDEQREVVRLWNMSEMSNVRAKFERLLRVTEHKKLAHYYIALSGYYMVQDHISRKENEQADKLVDDAIEHLNKAIEMDENFAEAYGLLSSCYGLKISVSPIKGMVYGPRSGIAISKAKEISPENPRIHLIEGISSFHTPGMFGGGKDKAKVSFEKAVKYFKTFQPASSLAPDWGKATPCIWLGRLAMERGELDVAEAHFNTVLSMHPENRWVSYVLLPKVKEMQLAENK